MAGVWYGFMPATGAVGMGRGVLAAIVLGRAAVGMLRAGRKLVVVHMIVVKVVHVAFVQIVGVAVVLHLRMAAADAMAMSMAFVRFAIHDPYLGPFCASSVFGIALRFWPRGWFWLFRITLSVGAVQSVPNANSTFPGMPLFTPT